jgi:ATP-binding cassette subfamily D (ALD) long-chain fatty acid import protein
LAELRERLAKVEMWKKRKGEIEEELGRVWVEGGEELEGPAYLEQDEGGEREVGAEEDAGNEHANEDSQQDAVRSETESVAASEQ